MRAGPSDSDCRVRVQTTNSGAGPMAGVVSVVGKGERTRQVRAGKTNASEPLMTCRKARRRHRNQAREVGLGRSSEEACRGSEWWPAYRRREPRAGVRAERGNLPPRCKGRNSSGGPTRMSVPRRGGGTDRLVVARKPGNAGGAKGPAFPGVRDRSTHVGRSRCLTPSRM